jgi:hypothetical protein
VSRRKVGPAKGPAEAWKPGDKAWRVDDHGVVHETTIRSEPWQICGHWSVLCVGISGGYLESRFHRTLYGALRGGIKQAEALSKHNGGPRYAPLVAARRALDACVALAPTSGGETPLLVSRLRAVGHLAPAYEAPAEHGPECSGEGGAA